MFNEGTNRTGIIIAKMTKKLNVQMFAPVLTASLNEGFFENSSILTKSSMNGIGNARMNPIMNTEYVFFIRVKV